MTLLFAAQLNIAAFGLAVAALSQCQNLHWRRWACVLALATEPAWFYSTWVASQWGAFAVSFIYVFIWGRAVYVYWLKGGS